MYTVINESNNKTKIMFHMGDRGFRLINNKTKSELLVNYKEDAYYLIDHNKNKITKYPIKDLLTFLKENKKTSLKEKTLSQSILFSQILDDYQIQLGASYEFKEIKVKNEKTKNVIRYDISYQEGKTLHSLWLTSPNQYELSESDWKNLSKAFKALYFFQKSLGQIDERSVLRSYVKILETKKLFLYQSVQYAFDPRQSRKSKVTKVESKELKQSDLSLPKTYKKSLFSN